MISKDEIRKIKEQIDLRELAEGFTVLPTKLYFWYD